MNSPAPDSSTVDQPAVPVRWTASRVQIAQVVSLCSGLGLLFPGLAAWLGWIDADHVRAWVESAVGGIGLALSLLQVVSNLFGIHFRAKSPLQPLTLRTPTDQAGRTSPEFAGSVAALALLLLVGSFAGGCGLLPQGGADTFNKKLDVALQTDKGIYQIADTLYNGHVITKADAQNVANQADNITSALDLARSIHETDPGAGQSKLDATVLALQGLTKYLNDRQHGVSK